MLSRVLEPEAMDTAEEARDYDAMDHARVNAAFVADFLAVGAGKSPVLVCAPLLRPAVRKILPLPPSGVPVLSYAEVTCTRAPAGFASTMRGCIAVARFARPSSAS